MKSTCLMIAVLATATLLRAEDAPKTPPVSVTPTVRYVHVNGDAEKFREDWWIEDGVTGGIEDFTFDQAVAKDGHLHVGAGAIFPEEDYMLELEIVKPEKWFVRAGFSEYRKYSDGTGGYYAPFSVPSFDLHRDLVLRNGRFFIEAGLTLPKLPKLTLGYEHLFKDGEKSLLEWGEVTETTATVVSRRIYPSFKDLDNTVDIIRLDAEHDIKKVHLADQFRYEHFRDRTTRQDGAANITLGTTRTVTVRESYTHDAFFNTFRAESYVNEKVYWSLGYLFTTLDGAGAFAVPTAPATGLDQQWQTQVLTIDQNSHVVNLNGMFGPFKGLTAYAGFQAEFTEIDGYTDALFTRLSSPTHTNIVFTTNDQQNFQETVGLRYQKIPFTTLYAEARWTERDYDLTESQTQDGAPDFARDTTTDVFRQDYSAGFNSAPLRRVTVSGRYRHSIHENDYDHNLDTTLGYPAFITAQDFTTDEVMARLTYRPISKLSLAFTYRLVQTDTDTTTDSVAAFGVPGGTLQTGDYQASIYSASATATPFSRLYLTGMFSYQDTRTISFANSNPALLTYDGDVYVAVAGAGYALDNKTDLTLEFTWSRADNFTDNSADGLPLGLDNQRFAILAGISRHLTPNIIARLRYGYYDYDEDSNGGIDDYTAHLAAASCTVRF